MVDKYKLLFDNMISGFAIHEMIFDENDNPVDYIFIDMNSSFEDLTGLKSQDIVNKSVTEVFKNLDNFWIEIYGTVVKTKKPAIFEHYDNVLKKHWGVRAYHIEENKFAAVFRDVTERVIREFELRVRNEINDIFLFSENGDLYKNLIYWLCHKFDSECGLLGYVDDLDNLVVLSYLMSDEHNLFKEKNIDDEIKFQNHIWRKICGRMIEDGKIVIYNNSIKVPDGHLPIDRAIISPIKFHEKLIGIIILANKTTDYDEQDLFLLEKISEIISPIMSIWLDKDKKEKERLKAIEQEKIAYKSRQEFLANISHELRTPLNGVMGMLQLLQYMDSNLTQTQRDYIKTAKNCSNNLLKILEDILDYTQMEKEKILPNLQIFDINDLISELTQYFDLELERKSIEFKLDIEENLPIVIKTDAGRLKQILLNIIGNAIKFTHSGHISLSVSLLHQNYILFIIDDTGIGIDPEKLDYIFDEFTQIDGGFTRQYEGIGLGLSIVKRLVKLFNATVCFDSHLNKGTSVYISWPIEIQEENNKNKDNSDKNVLDKYHIEKQYNILIVEDDPTSQRILINILKRFGYNCVLAGDGLEAVNLIKHNNFDLVLMDIQMPILDGIEATKKIRQFSDIKIIAVTAHVMEGDRKKFIDVGMNDYVSKPLDMGILRTKILNLIKN
jgi:signal transduction histidine kinase/CheY-like chemotaxis protein